MILGYISVNLMGLFALVIFIFCVLLKAIAKFSKILAFIPLIIIGHAGIFFLMETVLGGIEQFQTNTMAVAIIQIVIVVFIFLGIIGFAGNILMFFSNICSIISGHLDYFSEIMLHTVYAETRIKINNRLNKMYEKKLQKAGGNING